jgi:hypothetical protein
MVDHGVALAPKLSVSALAMFALLLLTAQAQSAPDQLLNKTVRYSFKVSAPTSTSDGRNVTASMVSQRTIYVSSKGRLFDRHARKDLDRAGSFEASPEESSFHFERNLLVGHFGHTSGASRLVITFDADFRTCSLEVTSGTESGKSLSIKGLNGIRYTATSKPTYSEQSCAVSEGNGLAN